MTYVLVAILLATPGTSRRRLQHCLAQPKAPTSSSPARSCINSTGGFAGGYSLVRWERWVADIHDVTFLQLGANQGPGPHEPVWEYATRCGWRGLTFEPTNGTFTRLCANYAPFFTLVKPIRAAVSNFTGAGQMEHITRYCPRGECNKLIDLTRQPVPMKSEAVDVVTLERAVHELRRAFLPHRELDRLDLLVVDVEGQEETVLGAPLPHPKPELVLYEHKHLQPTVKARIDASLRRQGYRFLSDIPHPAKNGFHWGDHLYGLR